jgi:hypothetical protein
VRNYHHGEMGGQLKNHGWCHLCGSQAMSATVPTIVERLQDVAATPSRLLNDRAKCAWFRNPTSVAICEIAKSRISDIRRVEPTPPGGPRSTEE